MLDIVSVLSSRIKYPPRSVSGDLIRELSSETTSDTSSGLSSDFAIHNWLVNHYVFCLCYTIMLYGSVINIKLKIFEKENTGSLKSLLPGINTERIQTIQFR